MTEATIRVKLDTRQAQSDLKALTKEAGGTATGVGKGLRGIRSGISRGLGAVGIGGALGLGFGAVQGALSSTAGGIFSESIGGYLSRASQWAFGDMGIVGESRASAREQVANEFGRLADIQGSIPAAAVARFKMLDEIKQSEGRGKRMFEQDSKFRGPDVKEVAMTIGEVAGREMSAIWNGMRNIGNAGALHPMYNPKLYKTR